MPDRTRTSGGAIGRRHMRCPRCAGNMLRHRDQYGVYAACLQCGKTVEIGQRSAAELAALAERWRREEAASSDGRGEFEPAAGS